MSGTRQLAETTLKPLQDKWIAQEGVRIVLRATRHEALLLQYHDDDDSWRMTRHPPDDGCAAWRWRGFTYADDGDTLSVLFSSDSPSRWCELYTRVLSVWNTPELCDGSGVPAGDCRDG